MTNEEYLALLQRADPDARVEQAGPLTMFVTRLCPRDRIFLVNSSHVIFEEFDL